jgi:hypothetical protein
MYERRPHQPSATVAAHAVALSAPHINIDERANAVNQENRLQTPGIDAAEPHPDQPRPSHSNADGSSHEPQTQSSPSTAARVSVPISPAALPDASAVFMARRMNGFDRLDTGEGSDSVVRVEDLSLEPVSNLDIPVAHSDAHREPSLRSADQSIDV